MAYPRRAWIVIEYDGKDITTEVSAALLSFSYTCNASDNTDSIDITVHDREGHWHTDWYPKVRVKAKSGSGTTTESAVQGAILRATIYTENWNGPGDAGELYCGAFEIDSCDLSGPPNVVSIKAVSTPISSSLRREEKCRAWEDVTLQKIAQDIAGNADMSLIYDVKEAIALDRVDQLQQADLVFLQKLCDKYGVSLKVTDKQLVLFEQQDYEQKDTIATFKAEDTQTNTNPGGCILSYKFSQDTSDTVSSSSVSYKDPKSGKLVQVTFEPDNAPATGQALNSNERPGNLSGDAYRNAMSGADGQVVARSSLSTSSTDTADDFSDIRADTVPVAMRQAKANARKKNKDEWTCELTVVGNTSLMATVTFNISGFGVYDGKYIIDEATHKLGGGYTTTIKAHRILEGY